MADIFLGDPELVPTGCRSDLLDTLDEIGSKSLLSRSFSHFIPTRTLFWLSSSLELSSPAISRCKDSSMHCRLPGPWPSRSTRGMDKRSCIIPEQHSYSRRNATLWSENVRRRKITRNLLGVQARYVKWYSTKAPLALYPPRWIVI